MGFQLKRHISAVVGLQDELDARLNIDNIDDVLTSSAVDHALSANQGRILEDKKLDKQKFYIADFHIDHNHRFWTISCLL